MMTRECLLFACLLTGLSLDIVRGQQPYSSLPPSYDIPPGRVIDEYKRQLEDDIYAVERKAEALAERVCIVGRESFQFCSLDLNILEFIICIYNPAQIQGSDAFIRGVKFPSSAFGSTPLVAIAIAGIGTAACGDVKVDVRDLYASGFNIEITGGNFIYPYSLTVQWVACPAKYLLYPSVRDFIPKRVPPPPPYFPNNYAPRRSSYGGSSTSYNQTQPSAYGENALTYDKNQPRYDETESRYEESSLPVDEKPSGYGQQSPNYGTTSPPYVQNPPNYEQTPPPYAPKVPNYG